MKPKAIVLISGGIDSPVAAYLMSKKYDLTFVYLDNYPMAPKISRKKAIGQNIGFLVIENGMFMTAILMTFGMPMIVEIGVFFDLLTAVLIMGVFGFRINESFDSIDVEKLRNLKG